MAKPPRLKYVKHVRAKGKLYAYFNTGERKDGKVIYAPLPRPSSPEFFVAYGRMKAKREKRAGYSLAAACQAYEESTDFVGKADSTKKLYRYALRTIEDALGRFPINDLRRDDIQRVLDHGLPSASAHNIFLAVLGLVYRHARRQGKTELNPVRDFDKIKGGSHEPWPAPVLEAALVSEHDRTRLAAHLLYFTGQRIGDVCKMQWSDVRGDEIFVTQQKTGKKLWIPMLAELRAELDRTPKRGMTILTREGGHPMTDQVIRKELKAHGAAMGVEVVPHGLRKNAVISLLEAGCSVAETAAITGQTYRIVEQYAAQIDQRRMGRAAIVKLETKRKRENG
ncbi:tyrosine-type recombinase/integrase [Aurantiacibacter spongiae]|uniref:Integrase n=1 Tax=Aurantiacibacter spongiae TaxID=2488860 RepID=A0A3N5CT07_9SPHN|nr:tyrosine-type recombinase/integrase [Aurantiacibacter spongiae]RPF70480.1 hypothetical protein EG799_01675 [Aurantiacibacter spongiae]